MNFPNFQTNKAPTVQGPQNPGAMPGAQEYIPGMPPARHGTMPQGHPYAEQIHGMQQGSNFLQALIGARPGGVRLPYFNPGKYLVLITSTSHGQTQNNHFPILRVECTVLITLDSNEAFPDRKSQRPGNEVNWVALKDPNVKRDFYARDVADFAEAAIGRPSEEIFTEDGVKWLLQAFNSGEFDWNVLEVDCIPQMTKQGKPIAKVHWVGQANPEPVFEQLKIESPQVWNRLVSGDGQVKLQQAIDIYKSRHPGSVSPKVATPEPGPQTLSPPPPVTPPWIK